MANQTIEIKFTVVNVPDGVSAERMAAAEDKAKEAFVMELLRHGEISAGRSAEILGINRSILSKLMYEYNISPFDETMTKEDLEREVADALKDFEPYT